MNTQHTPTPWNQGYSIPPFGDTAVIWNGRTRIADCERVEDAAFIVRACNAHDELVAAAKQLLHNAEFADGQGIILTHDAEAMEAALAKAGAE